MHIHRRVNAGFVIALVLFAPGLHAQSLGTEDQPAYGRIVGRVIDAQSGAGISAVTIQVVGTNIGQLTGIGGRFYIPRVPAGSATLRVTSIGYGDKVITDVQVSPDATVEQNISLEQEAVRIAAVEVTAAAERGSVNRALDQQRFAVGVVNAVTAEQISKSPDSDAASAVQRVAGVTLVDNKFVQVRGLGERYTTTSLNGARIPSPEPEKKIVPLDLFPAGLLETITTSKTFTPDQPGDFSGAQVDIKTREYYGDVQQAVSTTLGLNSSARGSLIAAPTTGSEWLGFGGADRRLSPALRAAGNFNRAPSQPEINQYIGLFRNAWSAGAAQVKPNTSLGASVSGSGSIAGQRLGYMLAGTYSYGTEVRDDEVRALAQPDEQGSTREIDRYVGTTGRTSVLWGGVLNTNVLVGSHSRLALNATYNRSADNEARHEFGTSENYGGLPLEISRLRYIERSVGSAQLTGAHELSDRQRVDWSVTGSAVARVEPDRSEIVYATESDPVTNQPMAPAWFSTAGEGAVRTYGDLDEKAFEAMGSYRVNLGADRQHALKFGGLFRLTDRTAENRAYSITAPTMTRESRELAPHEIFDGRFTGSTSSVFRLAPLSQGGSYTAEDQLAAAYAMLEWSVAPRMRMTLGARAEHSRVAVNAEPTIGTRVDARPQFTDVLPALTTNFQLTEKQNLRFSASQTLSRPEYRELAGVMYRDVLGGDNIIGNPDLERTLIRNVDLRWELYPSAGEVLSLAVFGKFFSKPIERVYLGTSGTRVTT
ncbi:MAG TPA: TonB-dependent receptor, partial [Longimicrobiales bacterium]|nr:TonB-dependent receptor [Longimicrobiales bacterium]